MKKIFKALVIAAAVVSAFPAVSCKKSNRANQFILGLDDSFPPFGFRNEKNEVVGYDIDLAREVAKRMGKELVCQPINWDTKELELNNNNIDCIWNGLTITEKRQSEMIFTKPYIENAQVVVVKKSSGFTTLADLKGKTIGVQAGSSAQDAINANPDFKASVKEIVEFADNVTAMNDLEFGKLDGVVMDVTVANYNIAQGKAALTCIEESLSPEEYGIAFKKGNIELRDKVQTILEEMAADGTVAKISTKWFGSDISLIGK